MAIVNGSLELGYKNLVWFNANPTLVLLEGQIVFLGQTGTYKIGDGIAELSALSFLGISSETQTLQNVTDLGNTTTNDIQFDAGVGILLDNTSRLREGTIDAGYGGNKGIAQICAVGYELKWESGSLYVMNGDGTQIRHTLYNFSSIPGATEDISKGFLVGTRWSLDNGNVYICTDNTITAAVWQLQSSDFTSAEKTKLSGIATGAEVNVNADWNATSGDAEILNKPTIPSIAGLELQANKQNSLTIDGTGVKYPTVDAINSAITNINTNAVDRITVKLALPITKGQAVYISSANGTNIIVSKASNTSEATSSKTLGLLETTGTTNDIVNVVTDGLLSGLNTSSATVGDAVWLGVTGALIFGLASKPYAPAHLVYIGVVSRVSATVGEIIVKVQNGFELNEIHDVDLKSTLPSNNEILTYESSTSLWKNKSVTTALGFTPYNSTNPSGYITGITSGNVTTALGFTPYNATNPSGYITSSALSTYVPYTGGTANVDLGLFYLKSKGLLINGSTETITLSTSATSPGGALGSLGMLMGNYDTTNNKAVLRSVLWGTGFKPLYLQGEEFRFSTGLGSVTEKMVINTNGNVAIGTTTASAKLDVFGGAADTRIRITGTSTTATAVFAGIEIVNNIGLSGCFFQNPSTNTTQYGGANSFNMINILNAPLTFGTNNLVNFKINGTASSGSSTTFTLTNQNNIGQTASANIPSLNYIGGARQWATGNITTQNEIVWGTTAYSFVAASVITNAYGNVFNAPTAGTNCTITNNFSALFNNPISLTQTVTTETAVQTRTVTIVINGTTYKLLAA